MKTKLPIQVLFDDRLDYSNIYWQEHLLKVTGERPQTAARDVILAVHELGHELASDAVY